MMPKIVHHLALLLALLAGVAAATTLPPSRPVRLGHANFTTLVERSSRIIQPIIRPI